MAPAAHAGAVEQAARDDYDAWYDGDAARMAAVLHSDLVKRRAGDELGTTTKERMVELTRNGEGAADGADRRLEIVVEDVHEDIAGVTVLAAVYHEHLHLVRTGGGWKIAHALWRPR